MGYYLAMRKNESLPSAATWMELEGIMLISQSEKDRYHVYTHMWILRNLTEDHGGGEGEKKTDREGGKPQETLKYREQTEGGWGLGERGKWVMGIEEGTYWDEH